VGLVEAPCAGSTEQKPPCPRYRVPEVDQVEVPSHLDEVPVVDPSSANRPLVDAETERADQVQCALGGGAKARKTPGIGWYFRFDEHNVEPRLDRPKSQAGRVIAGHGGPLRRAPAPRKAGVQAGRSTGPIRASPRYRA